MRIDKSGNVGIGTSTPAEKLSVAGKIGASEIQVRSDGWPDYVFESDYNLKTLLETEEYIRKDGHLPDMPSAKTIEANGLQVGEMLKLQQQKIEELTLHLIQKDKQLTSQQEELNLMKAMLNKQQQLLENIKKQLK